MSNLKLKSTLAAVALVLSFAAVPAQAVEPSRNTGVGKDIAAQGNAALVLIRAELTAAVAKLKAPALPRPRKVSRTVETPVPATTSAGSLASTARCDE